MIQKKRKIKKSSSLKAIFFPAIIVFSILIFVVFLAISNWRINQRKTELTSQAKDLKREIEALEKRNDELKTGIRQSESNEYWEDKLYEQGYKKPGEEVLVVLPPKENENKSEKEEKKFWQKIWEKIGF